jgi:hypothetical protein
MIQHILDNLLWQGPCLTKNGQLGDAMSANAAMALVTPNDSRIHGFVKYSFIGNRPYRSPIHAQHPELHNPAETFSRDHCLSLAWYTLWSGNSEPLIKICNYAKDNKFKVGAEGTYSQMGLTPNVLWAFGAICQDVPWWCKIFPSFLIAMLQYIQARSVPVGYRLNLCAELTLMAKLTGKYNWLWGKVAALCYKRQPENLYYAYIAGVDKSIILPQLEEHILTYVPADDWCWCWMNKDANGHLQACGPDLAMLYLLLSRD